MSNQNLLLHNLRLCPLGLFFSSEVMFLRKRKYNWFFTHKYSITKQVTSVNLWINTMPHFFEDHLLRKAFCMQAWIYRCIQGQTEEVTCNVNMVQLCSLRLYFRVPRTELLLVQAGHCSCWVQYSVCHKIRFNSQIMDQNHIVSDALETQAGRNLVQMSPWSVLKWGVWSWFAVSSRFEVTVSKCWVQQIFVFQSVNATLSHR